MNAKKVISIMKKAGWKEVRANGSHRIFAHPDFTNIVPVPFHGSKDIAPGTLKSIAKGTGLTFNS